MTPVADHPSIAATPFAAEDLSVLAERAYSRTSGADAIHGNAVKLLIDAGENYPAWLDAIRGAQKSILFEMYIIDDDVTVREFVAALAERARAGVTVKVLVDWLGGRRGFHALKGSRTAAPKSASSTLPASRARSRGSRATTARPSRSTIASASCPAVRERPVARRSPSGGSSRGATPASRSKGRPSRAAARVRDRVGRRGRHARAAAARRPSQAPKAATSRCASSRAAERPGTYRLDLTIASVARSYLWLTDAYFVGTSAYVARSPPRRATASTCACSCPARRTSR
jgi:cardiolipin synthase